MGLYDSIFIYILFIGFLPIDIDVYSYVFLFI